MAVSFISQTRLCSTFYAHRMHDIRTACLSLSRLTRTRECRFFSSTRPVQSAVARFRPANRLSGRTCMVTGGSSGIGFAIAERFLQEGASSIILVGRSQQRLQAAADNLHASTGAVSGENSAQDASERIRLVVGDVGEAASWIRELEKEMVHILTL